MNPLRNFIGFAATALLAAGSLAPATSAAQAQPAPGADGKGPEAAARDDRYGGLTAELMYRILVGDVALQRGDAALAVRAYYEAARDARDLRLARRATEIAVATRQRGMAVDAARLWSELDPAAERPRQVIASGGTDGGSSVRDLKVELERALADAAAQSRSGEAFLQINRMLASEPDKAATFRLVQSLAKPYPAVAEAQLAVALAAYNVGTGDPAMAGIAMSSIDRALALRPGWEQAVLLKAELLVRDSPDKAAQYLVDFLRVTPESKVALAALGQVRIQQKRYADAAAILRDLSAKDPDNHEYQFGLAMLAVQMKDWKTAESLFETLRLADYGDEGLVEFYLAQIAEETGRFDLALERFRAVPEGDRAWLAKLRAATMLGKLGRVDEARKYLAGLPAETSEQRVQVLQVEAQILRDAGDSAGALAVLTQALADHPDDPDLLYDLAMVAEKLDRLDVAEAKLSRLIELKPSNAHALNALGYTLVDRTPRVAEGLALIERALAIMPNDPFILDSMGWAQYRMGRLDDAETSLRKAMDERPDPEIAAHLGEVLWVKGDHARAQDLWQSQLKNAPENAVLLETMRRLTR